MVTCDGLDGLDGACRHLRIQSDLRRLDQAKSSDYWPQMDYEPKGDLYTVVLGVAETATPEEIKRAHRVAIKSLHPDRPGGDAARAAVLNHARDVLLDPKQRAAYDAKRRAFGARLREESVRQARAAATPTPPAPRPSAKKRPRPTAAPSKPVRSRPRAARPPVPPAAVSAEAAFGEFFKRASKPRWGDVSWWVGTAFWGVVAASTIAPDQPKPRTTQRPRRSASLKSPRSHSKAGAKRPRRQRR